MSPLRALLAESTTFSEASAAPPVGIAVGARHAGVDHRGGDVVAADLDPGAELAVGLADAGADGHLPAVEEVGEAHRAIDPAAALVVALGALDLRRRDSGDLDLLPLDVDRIAVEHAVRSLGVVALAKARRPTRGVGVGMDDGGDAHAQDQHRERDREQGDAGDSAQHLALGRGRLGRLLHRHRLAADSRRGELHRLLAGAPLLAHPASLYAQWVTSRLARRS